MTSPTSGVPNGWRLQDIPNDELASLLQISRREVAARRATFVKQLADPAWVAVALEELPAATLALLHVLIDAGGLAMEHELARAAHEAFGMSVTDCQAAAAPAISRMLVVPLRIQAGEIAYGVVLPAGAFVAPLVANLDLYELPHAAFVAAFVATEAPVRNARTFLAACVAARHFDVKLTHEGRPHRGSSKRLARQVGLDEASLEAMLMTGLDLGMLSLEGEFVRPDLDVLADAAIGRYPRSLPLAELHAQLAGGPIASAALVRSFLRRFDGEPASLVGGDALAYLPGFEIGTVGGVPAVARCPLEGAASGHVTPSFEVILPPESPLLDIVRVGACCEWERLDRAIVARITKSSIARAVTGGATAGQILAQLAAASRHPIPQNVEAAIRDWASAVISATIATGHVIVVDPSARARVASALAKVDARELAPGVLVVGDGAELREITLALTRAGIYHREVSPVRPPPPGASEPEPSLPAPGAARLRARVAAWRRGEPFEGVRDDFLDKHRTATPTPPAASITGKPSDLLERWAVKHGCRFDDPHNNGILPILSMLSTGEVASLLDRSHDVDQLLRALAKVVPEQGLTRLAKRSARRGGNPGGGQSPLARAGQAPPWLRWQRTDLRERLQHAARRAASLAVQLANGTRYLAITQLMRRGTIWMVLGEDLMNEDAVALRLDDIQAIAELPDDFDVELETDGDDGDDDGRDDGLLGPAPWRPGHGEAIPPGHVPCPCGSGMRYRHCCRDLATA